jgi:hypothetical protein
MWDLSGHPLLSAGIEGERLAEFTELAELLLGLRPYAVTDFTTCETEDLQRALVLQVNLEAVQDPEAFLATTLGRGAENISYRDGVLLHPVSVAIVEPILAAHAGGGGPSVEAGDYLTILSYRP